MNNISKKIAVAIIGLGPRGLSVLERLICFAKLEKYADYAIDLYLIDPGLFGAGAHPIDQKDYILLNTPVYLPTLFPGDIFDNSDLAGHGLSFNQWISQHPQIMHSNSFETHSLQPGVYLPRRLLGQYLHWVYTRLTEQLPNNVAVNKIKAEARNLSREGDHYLITISDETRICVEYLFVTIGHAERNDLKEIGQRIIKNPYPIHEKFSDSSYKKVAVAGMGLVAFDVISELTIGRGGKFIRSASKELEYRPSGKEPEIYLYSKSGIPYRARPIRESEFNHEPIRLTRAAIRKIRVHPEEKLDFYKDVMPLVYDEMSISYYIASVRNAEGNVAAQKEYQVAKQSIIDNDNFRSWLEKMIKQFGAFDPRLLIHHDLSEALATTDSYRNWVISYLKADISEAQKGPMSPVKCAIEALLQVREGIREAVEFNGLTPSSSKDFFYKISPLINRNAIGPELLRIEELLALIQAGIVNLSLGPNPSILKQTREKVVLSSTQWRQPILEVDLFCEAYLKSLTLDQWDSIFVKNMIHEGIIQSNSAKDPGLLGVQIDRSFRAIPSGDKKESNVWVVGIMCEGTTYYNNYVPIVWQGAPSTPFLEVHAAVDAFFSTLDLRSQADGSAQMHTEPAFCK